MNRVHDETSRALLDAAHRLLADHGPDALTVRRIAGEAGMSTMNVYSRFGGKDGVIDELYIHGYQRLLADIDAVPHTDDIPADLLKVANAYRRFAQEHPTYYGVMFRSAVPGFSPTAASIDLALNGLSNFVGRIVRGQQLGQIRAREGCDPREIAAWLWAMCHGIVSLELDEIASEHLSWESIFLNGVQVAIRGLHPSVDVTTFAP